MVTAEVLVVEETPSLASSLVAFLEAHGIPVRRFPGLSAAESYHAGGCVAHPLVVVASNSHYCSSANRWCQGPLREADLVVVGTRDPALRSSDGLHVVRLPLEPARLLELVQGILHRPTGTSS